MEDTHAAVLDLDGSGESSNAFFAVYDGHGGVFLSSTILTLKVPISVIRTLCIRICWSKCAQTTGHRKQLQGTKVGNGTQASIYRD